MEHIRLQLLRGHREIELHATFYCRSAVCRNGAKPTTVSIPSVTKNDSD